uniref:Uncharacterized protein n=1 Tax=Macrostomum lignano TaxID=282301 RepID=A0A1I8I6K8_9PLAT
MLQTPLPHHQINGQHLLLPEQQQELQLQQQQHQEHHQTPTTKFCLPYRRQRLGRLPRVKSLAAEAAAPLRRSRVRQLRRHQHAVVAPRWRRSLPVQRVRPLPEDERQRQTAGEAQEEADNHPPGWHHLLELQHNIHHSLAQEWQRRTRVQRMRSLLQAAQREPAGLNEERRHPDSKPTTIAEVKKATSIRRRRRSNPRRRRRFDQRRFHVDCGRGFQPPPSSSSPPVHGLAPVRHRLFAQVRRRSVAPGSASLPHQLDHL